MRICPACGGAVNEFDSVCDYCGTELSINKEFEAAIKVIDQILISFKQVSNASHIITKSDLQMFDKAIFEIKNAKSIYGESRKMQRIIAEIEEIIPTVTEKIEKYKIIQYRKTEVFTILLSLLSIFGLFILLYLISIFDSEDVKTWVVGIPALICALIGMGLSSDSRHLWGAFLGGMIVGGIIGYLIFLLIGTSVGQLILLIAGTLGVIIFAVFRIKGAKRKLI